jgi:hypothetical protein
LTKRFDGAVKPIPILQIINLILNSFVLVWEWFLEFLANTSFHGSIKARLLYLPFPTLTAVFLYQGLNPAIYYFIDTFIYFWVAITGENIHGEELSSKIRALEPLSADSHLQETILTILMIEPLSEPQPHKTSQTQHVHSITAKKYNRISGEKDISPYFDPSFRMACGSLHRHLENTLKDAFVVSITIQRLHKTEEYPGV